MKPLSTIGCALGWAMGGTVAYALCEPHRITVREWVVELPNLPANCENLRVLQLSDLHISAITGTKLLRRVVQMSNDLLPDVIVLTGDFISRRSSYSELTGARIWARPVMEYAARMADEIAELRAPEGVFAVPGNHDHANGKFTAIENLLENVGVHSLLNANMRLRDTLPLCGVDDVRSGRPKYLQAFEGVEPNEAQIILSHNPRVMPLLRGRNALLLTGHSHAGQVHLPFTDFRRRSKDLNGSPWFEGWYRQHGTQMYVSSGIGSVHFPARLRCPPEITVFILKRSKAKDEN